MVTKVFSFICCVVLSHSDHFNHISASSKLHHYKMKNKLFILSVCPGVPEGLGILLYLKKGHGIPPPVEGLGDDLHASLA